MRLDHLQAAGLVAGLLMLLAGANGQAEEAFRFDEKKMTLSADFYRAFGIGDEAVTEAGRALCRAMKLPAAFPCDTSTILDAAQQQVDPELWIDRIIDPTGPQHGGCLRPVVIESRALAGGAVSRKVGCHAAPESESVSDATVTRLLAAARQLRAREPKTIATLMVEDRLMNYVDELEATVR